MAMATRRQSSWGQVGEDKEREGSGPGGPLPRATYNSFPFCFVLCSYLNYLVFYFYKNVISIALILLPHIVMPEKVWPTLKVISTLFNWQSIKWSYFLLMFLIVYIN